MVFKSKVGVLFYSPTFIIPLIPVPVLQEPFALAIQLFILVPVELLIIGLIFHTTYPLTNEGLSIKCFISRITVILSQKIVSIKETRNSLFGAALSLERLEIKYMRENGRLDITLISPKNKENFLNEVQKRNRYTRFYKQYFYLLLQKK